MMISDACSGEWNASQKPRAAAMGIIATVTDIVQKTARYPGSTVPSVPTTAERKIDTATPSALP